MSSNFAKIQRCRIPLISFEHATGTPLVKEAHVHHSSTEVLRSRLFRCRPPQLENTLHHGLQSDMAASRTFTENTSLQEVLATFRKLRQDDVLLDTTIRVSYFITHERI